MESKSNLSPVILSPVTMDRQARTGYNVKNPKGKDILIGTILFLSCLILYCFQTFLIKIML